MVEGCRCRRHFPVDVPVHFALLLALGCEAFELRQTELLFKQRDALGQRGDVLLCRVDLHRRLGGVRFELTGYRPARQAAREPFLVRSCRLAVGIDDLEMANKLRSASTHWLRHTFATHGIGNGIALETIRDMLDYKSLTATSVYVTTEKDKRSREVEKLRDLTAF